MRLMLLVKRLLMPTKTQMGMIMNSSASSKDFFLSSQSQRHSLLRACSQPYLGFLDLMYGEIGDIVCLQHRLETILGIAHDTLQAASFAQDVMPCS